jgi:hypothetical protein
MVRAFELTAMSHKIIFARLIALDPRWAPAADPNAATALESAALNAERNSAKNPTAKESASLLEHATYARLALDDPDQARQNLKVFRQQFAPDRPDAAAILGAGLARHYLLRNDPATASRVIGSLGAATRPRTLIFWHLQRARALVALDRFAEARPNLDAALAAYGSKEPHQVVGPPAPEPMLGRELVMQCVGEAHLLYGDFHASKAAAEKPPRYHGTDSLRGAKQFLNHDVIAWAHRRQETMAHALSHYHAVAGLEPVPPPKALVTASRRAGVLWSEFATTLLGIAIPASIASDDEAKAALRATASPALKRAHAAFEACSELARSLHLDNTDAVACNEWLEEHPEITDP